MASTSYLEQFAALKSATLHTGVIHEAQALQLRNYPLLVPGVSCAEAHVDIEHKTITYECQGRPVKGCVPACKEIAGYIQKFILWDETVVVVKFGKKVVYDSRE